jgi:nucleoside 2-deoxyribosyltransferase
MTNLLSAATPARRVYISGPLQHVHDLAAARRLYEDIAAVCRDAGWQPYLPHQNTDPARHTQVKPTEVFVRDMRELRIAAVVVACIGEPSSGVGAELAFSVSEGKSVIAIHHRSQAPSRFLVGMLSSYPSVAIREYDSLAECRDLVKDYLHNCP